MSSEIRRWQALDVSEAEAFDRYMVPRILGPLAERLLDALGLGPGERLLDLACGTGAVAKPAFARTGRGGRVVGLDTDSDSIAVARGSSADAIEYVVGSADRVPFPVASFDAVACQQGLQFFDDRQRALAEIRRVLVAGGRLAASVWAAVDEQPVFGAIRRALLRHAGDEVGGSFFVRPSSLGQPGQLEDLLRSAGLAHIAVEDAVHEADFPSVLDFLEQYGAATGFGNTLAALRPEHRDAVVADIERDLPSGRLALRYWLATARS